MKYTVFGPLSTVKWALIDWNGNPNSTNIYDNLIKIFGTDQANEISRNIKSSNNIVYNLERKSNDIGSNLSWEQIIKY